MTDKDQCSPSPEPFDGGGRIVAKIPINHGPRADEIWRLYKQSRETDGLSHDAKEAPEPRRYSVKRRGGDHLYISHIYDDEE